MALLVHKETSGFTLIEILVVLAILAITMSIIQPQFSQSTNNSQLKAAALLLAADLRITRSKAVSKQQSTQLVVNVKKKIFSTKIKNKAFVLPKEAIIRMKAVQSETVSDHVAAIRFYPDGSSTGGNIRLLLASKGYCVTVSWLTGRVDVAPWFSPNLVDSSYVGS